MIQVDERVGVDRILENVVAVVMAGGMGARLRPLTDVRSKPAMPFAGIHRIVDFPLSSCINSGIRRILVLTQYKSQSLSQHLKKGWSFLSRNLDQFIDEVPAQMQQGSNWYSGTANAIRQNVGLLDTLDASEVLILSGDHVYKMDYGRMKQFHDEKRAAVTIAVARATVKRARRQFGVVEAREDGRVVSFKEKPQHPKRINGGDECYASMGIYLFNYKVLKELLRDDPRDFGRGIFSKISPDGARVFAYDFSANNAIPEWEFSASEGERTKALVERASDSDYWRDIGTVKAYWRAHLDLVATTPRFNLYGERWPIFSAPLESPPAKFVHESYERTGIAVNSLISNGVIISGAHVRSSVLGPHVYVHSYSLIENSVLLGGLEQGSVIYDTSIGRSCRVRNAIVDKSVRLRPGTTIGYDRREDERRGLTTYVLDGEESYLVVVPRGLSI